jgi:hypothetical protein
MSRTYIQCISKKGDTKMYRNETSQTSKSTIQNAVILSENLSNMNDVDTVLTPNPTPKSVSRRAWRRRRVKEGKS